jgi:hypothetical protein
MTYSVGGGDNNIRRSHFVSLNLRVRIKDRDKFRIGIRFRDRFQELCRW